MRARGLNADFRATGQTGILIAGRGVAIDAVVSDFIAGAAEWLSPDNDADHWDIIEGQGSLFTLQIPLAVSQRNLPTPEPTKRRPAGDGQGRPVLLVEDNPVNQTVIEAMLRSLGYEVCVVDDGAKAVEQTRTRRFAAVLMDCRLPVLDGYDASRRIRRLPGCAELPIIALTANALEGDREACLAAGMNDYLAKPFKRADLQQILLHWLG